MNRQKNSVIIHSSLLALCLGIALFSGAQTATPEDFVKPMDVLPPPPNAAELGKYGGIELAMNTGMINQAIPLYSFKSSTITLPIGLRYSSGGFKPDEFPSRTGMGWVLEVGGVITRTVVGGIDEYSERHNAPIPIQANATGFNFLNNVGGDAQNSNWDAEPDQYSYNFNGNSGRFVFDINGNIVGIPATNLKIEKGTTTDWSFRITTTDGMIYYFGGSGATEYSKKESGCGKAYFAAYTPTSWYLNKIESPLGDVIEFAYEELIYSYVSGISQTLYIDAIGNDGTSCTPNANVPSCVSYASQSKYCTSIYRAKGVLLKAINSTSAGNIQFAYRAQAGNNDMLFDSIKVYDLNGVLRKQYKLEYDIISSTNYSNSYNGSTDRAYLAKVSEVDLFASNSREYRFAYNGLSELPVTETFSIDHWGYFNGKSNYSLVPKPDNYLEQEQFPTATADRSPNGVYAAKGLLSKIEYPTGGYDTIEYEGNSYFSSWNELPAEQSISSSVTGTSIHTDVTVSTSTFTVAYAQSAKFEYIVIGNSPNSEDYSTQNIGYAILRNLTTGQSQQLMSEPHEDSWKSKAVVLQTGMTYRLDITAVGSIITTNILFKYRPGSLVAVSGNLDGPGVRVKRVTTVPLLNGVPKTKRYYYSELQNIFLDHSSGATPGLPQYRIDFTSKTACLGEASCPQRECLHSALYSASQSNLHIFPSDITYSVVLESEGEEFENGGIEHRYTIASDYPPQNLMTSWGGEVIPGVTYNNSSFYNGREVQTIIYRKDGQDGEGHPVLKKVKSTTFHLKVDLSRSVDVPGCLVTKRYEYCTGDPNAPSYSMMSSFNAEAYTLYSRWVYVDTMTEILYDNSEIAYMTNVTVNYYDNPSHMLLTRMLQSTSGGEKVLTQIKYPLDFGGLTSNDPITAGVQLLKDKYVIGTPIEKSIFRTNSSGGSPRLLSSNFHAFKSNVPLPDAIYQVERKASLTDFSAAQVMAGALSKDGRYQRQLVISAYDSKGNVLDQNKEYDLHTSYIWDYGSEYPIAEIHNCSSNDAAYTSFESDGSGNWSVGSIYRPQSNAVTGNVYYDLSFGSVSKAGIAISKKYVISFWKKSGSVSISGLSGSLKQGRSVSINGSTWTYFEGLVTGVSSVSLSGSGQIDELRLYPQGAFMITYTYTPLVGATSKCDENNLINYFEYDGLNRLHIIRDQDYHIIKTIDYKYKELVQ